MKVSLLASGAALALLLVPVIAAAGDKQADTLFNEGLKLLDDGKIAEACSSFEESRKLEGGVGVTLYLADCEEKLGHLVRARTLFYQAETLAHEKKDARQAQARARAEALDARIPMLRVRMESGAPPPPIEVDGERGDWTHARAIDPGKHVVRAPERNFEQIVDAPSTNTEVIVTISTNEARPALPRGQTPLLSPLRIVGIAAMGAGVFSTLLSFGLGADAISKKNASNDAGRCDAMNRCDAEGLSLRSGADSAATASTFTFFLGVGLVAAGAVLFVLAPSLVKSPPSTVALAF